jgi:hypothetical protein
MFSCTRYETKQIQEGLAMSVTRAYPSGCPHEVGSRIVLTSKYLTPNDGEVPFAVGVIMSVRPVTFDQMRHSDKYAQMDGFPNVHAWEQHFTNVLYKGANVDAPLFRLQFRMEELERDQEALAPRQSQETEQIEVG